MARFNEGSTLVKAKGMLEIRCDLPVKAKTSTSIFMLTIIPTITPSSNQVAPGFHHGKINLSGSLSSCQ
ncbi:hypothetical protein Peur_068732 [Populus x canadensis]